MGLWSRVTRTLRRRGVRGRSTAAAVVVVAVALALGATALIYLLQRGLISTVASDAESRALEVATRVRDSGEDGLTDNLVATTRTAQVVQVVDANGRVVASSSPRADETPLTDARPADGQLSRNEVSQVPLIDEDDPYLIVARGTRHEGAGYTVIVAASVAAQRETVSTVTQYLIVGYPLLLLLVGAATWVLVGRALGPVERIRRRVHGIGTAQLDERVPVPASDDEITRLAMTMNQMLDRLQDGQEQQRRFVADASHELRSPIATLTAALEVVGTDDTGRSWRELQEVMSAETDRMRRLVEDLLLLAKADDQGLRLRRLDVDIDDLVHAEIRRLRRAGAIVAEGDVQPVRVVGDPDRLGQAIRNLADNAVQAEAATVRFTTAREQGAAVITVDDDGRGIPASERSRIFERFVRLDDSRDRRSGGSGLGLSIVHEVVRGHGGTVDVQDSPLGGARFVLRIPEVA